MKILSLAQGFVTNSSSANYWLNNEEHEEGGHHSHSTTTTATSATIASQTKEKETSPNGKNFETKNETENKNQTQKIGNNQIEKKSPESDNYPQISTYKENILEGALILIFFSIIFVTVFLIKKFKK